MTIRDYINSLDFEKVKFFQKKRNLNSIRVFRAGKNHFFQESSIKPSFDINMDEYDLKISSHDITTFRAHFQEPKNGYQNSSKHHDISSIIQFLSKGIVKGQLNCNFLRSQFSTKENESLNYSSDDITNIYSWAKKQSHQIMPYRPAGIEQNMWQQFAYPKSYYFNSNFNVFETTMDINLNSVNSKSWRLEIPILGERPTISQLQTIEKFCSKRWEIRTMILDKLYHFYQSTARHDFDLPELSNQEQLFYFIRSGSIALSMDNENIITIGFGTWDEEHGAYYSYFVNENRIEET